MVVPEEAARSVPPAAKVTAPDVGRAEEDAAGGSPTLTSQAQLDVAAVASEVAAQSMPPEAQVEVTTTATSPARGGCFHGGV